MTKDALDEYNIIISIDFGTTYSGYKIWCPKNPVLDSRLHIQIPILVRKTLPTTVLYKKSSNVFSTKRNKKPSYYGDDADWMYRDFPGYGYYVSKVKLWLDRTAKEEDLPPLPYNKFPVQVIADYLSKLRKEIYRTLNYDYPEYNDPSKYRFCMAVPTMWSEESKNILREAVILSKFMKKDDPRDKLLIVDEAVAAALYAEDMSPELELCSGNLYMICDAGGGTVDLAVFEKDDSLGAGGLKEITMGTGSSCGSIFLDTRFKDLLSERLSAYPAYNKYYMKDVMKYFINGFKIEFGSDDDKEMAMDLIEINQIYACGHPNISEKDGFTVDEIRTKVFDPVVDKVLCMIERQFEQLNGRHIDAMFITGGFGLSPYLQNRIKDVFGNRTRQFKVIENGNWAVMEGAILFGTKPRIITQRILRRTYGIKLCSPDETKDDNKAQSEKDRFHVYIHKGQPVNKDTWLSKKIHWLNNKLPIISLYAYDGEEPIPEYPTPQEIDLVAILGTQFLVDKREGVDRVIAMKMRFGLDRIEVKVNIADKEFEYVTICDVAG